MPAIPVRDLYLDNNAYLDLYVIGYESMGESIIINIDNKFIGVIDCYKTNNDFITKELLDNMNKKYLDFICWSHPDLDHTIGLSDLFYLVDKENTVFILPEGLSAKEILSKVNYKKDESIHNEFIKLLSLVRENIVDYNVVSANQGSQIYKFGLKLKGDDEEAIITISSFAPISNLVRNLGIKNYEKIINGKKLDRESNIYSIGLKVDLQYRGKLTKILLCSDIEDETINNMHPISRQLTFEDSHIFKIPHHCSTSSKVIIESNIVKSIDFACTTSYRKHSLPNIDLLKEYCNINDNIRVCRTDNFSGKCGYVHYKIPVFNSEIDKTEVIYKGAAGEYRI